MSIDVNNLISIYPTSLAEGQRVVIIDGVAHASGVGGISGASGGSTDLSSITVTADKILDGYIAIDSTGTQITGTIPTISDITLDGRTIIVDSGYTGDDGFSYDLPEALIDIVDGRLVVQQGYVEEDYSEDLELATVERTSNSISISVGYVAEPIEFVAEGGGGGSGAFDLAKVTEYDPYAPAMTSVTSVAVSGIGDWIYSDDPENEDYEYNEYYSEANGWYYVTPETAGETNWKKRVYKHESKEYYLYYQYYDDYPDESTWFFSTSTDSDGQFIRKYNEYDWDNDEPLPVGNLESGEGSWGDYVWEPFSVTLDVHTTSIPETPMVLKGVLATGYADGEWSFDTAEHNFAGFEETPVKDYMYAVGNADNMLVGSPVAYIDIFPGTSALFALDASRGTTELVNGGTPALVGSGTVLQNGEFCFDTVRALDYTIGNTMSALKDFTIEMDYTITSDNTGYCGFLGNKRSWSTMCVCMQWGRSGYRPAMFWNDYFYTTTGGSEHREWVSDGKYHHVAMVRKGSIVSLYSDGQLIASYSGATKDLNLAIESILAIGTQHVENVIFPGRMKHFRVLPLAKYTNAFKLPSWVGK